MRRYAPLAPSSGTRIPAAIRSAVLERDKRRCVGPLLDFPGPCYGTLELDHVRASHAIGMKSETTVDNLVTLCGGHHRWKTENGRRARALLGAYLAAHHDAHFGHVDPCCSDCPAARRWTPERLEAIKHTTPAHTHVGRPCETCGWEEAS